MVGETHLEPYPSGVVHHRMMATTCFDKLDDTLLVCYFRPCCRHPEVDPFAMLLALRQAGRYAFFSKVPC